MRVPFGVCAPWKGNGSARESFHTRRLFLFLMLTTQQLEKAIAPVLAEQPINEKIVVINRQPHCQATWWLLNGEWHCVGAMKAISNWVPGLTPEKAMQLLRQSGKSCTLISTHNPQISQINPSKSIETAASLLRGQQSNRRGSLNTHIDKGVESTPPTVGSKDLLMPQPSSGTDHGGPQGQSTTQSAIT